jgi:hypothetical protein
MNKIFHICTIVNRPEQHREMRQSFDTAGFTDALCRFSTFDNITGNRYDPYRLLDTLIADTPEQYLILCHQDVRPDLGHSAADLISVLGRLSELDKNWIIAGNAGVDFHGTPLLHLDDPNNHWRSSGLPRQVMSLDENFLVIKPRSGLSTSPELNGFHFYATDLALNAKLQQGSAYVINFLLTHLSSGDIGSSAFAESKERFTRVWRERLLVGLIRTTTGNEVLVSRAPVIEMLLRRRRIGLWLWRLGLSVIPMKMRHRPAAETMPVGSAVRTS